MKRKFILLFLIVGIIPAILVFLIKSNEGLSFTENSNGESWSEFQRKDKRFKIKKQESDGSGQYVIYSLYREEANKQLELIGEFTTCGTIKLREEKIEFYGPKEFHCGNFSFWTDFMDPQVTTFVF